MRWSPWKMPDSEGNIAAELLPASIFQMRRFLLIEGDIGENPDPFGSIFGSLTWNGQWRWQIVQDQTVLFDQTIHYSVDLVYLAAGGALSFFTWWFNYTAHKVETIVPQPVYLFSGAQGGTPQVLMGRLQFAGPGNATFDRMADAILPTPCCVQPVPKLGNRAVQATLRMVRGGAATTDVQVSVPALSADALALPDNFSSIQSVPSVAGGSTGDELQVKSQGWVYNDAEDGIADPSGYPPGTTEFEDLPGDSGYTDHTFILAFFLYLQPYRVSIPSGSRIVLKSQALGGDGFWPMELASVYIRTGEGGGVGSLIDEPGYHRFVLPTGTTLEQLISPDLGKTYSERRIGGVMSNPSIMKSAENHLLVGAIRAKHYVLLCSYNDGRTWSPLTHWGGLDMADWIWDSDEYQDITTAIMRAGIIVSFARRNTTLVCKSSVDGFTMLTTIGACEPNTFHLSYDAIRDHLLVTDGKTAAWLSSDAGKSWRPVAAVGLLN